jgi:NADPH:quinone reductase-like Zn-dependent oxidoreductase
VRAYALPSFDAPAALTDVPTPEAGPGEIRIRVLRSSVNPFDQLAARGTFRFMDHRFPAVLGRDVAGVVDQVGDGATRFAIGDEVFGFVKRGHVGDGTFAEHVVVPADRFTVPVPAGLALDQAGVLGQAAVTALQCVQALGCSPGETVFVNGATGGVGSFAVQWAKRSGLRVLATAQPGAPADHVRGLGADDTVDWTAGDVPGQVRTRCPDGVHGLVDLVSADAGAMATLADSVLQPGRASATTRGKPPAGDPSGTTFHGIHCDPRPDLLQVVADAAVDGLVVPLVASYPLEEIDDAFAALGRAPLGKVGLELG